MVTGNKYLDFGRERERGAGKVMLLEIDLDFCVYVRENERERERGKEDYIVWFQIVVLLDIVFGI